MRYFYDFEFIEDGRTIDPISVGIVAEDGREYYAQSSDFLPFRASEWVQQNVFPHLLWCPHTRTTPHEYTILYDKIRHKDGLCMGRICREVHNCPWRTHDQISHDVMSFMVGDQNIELWGYYSAYDHVAFCQLFGTMMDLPDGYPYYTRDLKQFADMLGVNELPEQTSTEHNALADAKWNKEAWDYLMARGR